jgi:site-specific recombinase XerD
MPTSSIEPASLALSDPLAIAAYLGNLQARRVSKHTLNCYAGDLRQFEKYLASHHHITTLDRIQPKHLGLYQDYLSLAFPSPRTHSRKIASVRSYLGYAYESGLIEKDLCEEKPGGTRDVPLPIPSPVQVIRLVECFHLGTLERAVMELLMLGFKSGEIETITRTMVNLSLKAICVDRRIIKLTPRAQKAIEAFMNTGSIIAMIGPMFLSKHGRPIDRQHVSKIFVNACEQMEVTGIMPRDLRRLRGGELLLQGESNASLREQLGLGRLGSLAIYAHAASQLAALYANPFLRD